MRVLTVHLVTLVLVGSLALMACAAPPAAEDLVKASLVADTSAVQPGQPFKVGVLLKIAPQWHVYWQNAGEGGVPTTVNLRLPDGFVASPLQYPVPKHLPLQGGLFAYGYEDEVMLTATITPPAKIDSSNVSIGAESNWLVCEKVCVMGNANVSLTLPVADAAGPDQQALFKAWTSKLPVPVAVDKRVASYNVEQRPGEILIRIDWRDAPPADIEWFPPASDALNFGAPRVDTKGKTTTITAPVERLAGQQLEEKLPDSVVAYRTPAGRSGIAVPVKWQDKSRE